MYKLCTNTKYDYPKFFDFYRKKSKNLVDIRKGYMAHARFAESISTEGVKIPLEFN